MRSFRTSLKNNFKNFFRISFAIRDNINKSLAINQTNDQKFPNGFEKFQKSLTAVKTSLTYFPTHVLEEGAEPGLACCLATAWTCQQVAQAFNQLETPTKNVKGVQSNSFTTLF